MSSSVSAQDSRRFAASLLASIIGDDVGSRFFWELVDKALAETASMQFSALDQAGVLYSYIRCGVENVNGVLDIVRKIFHDLSVNGVSDRELQTAKNKALSSLVLKNELPMGRLVDLGFNWQYLEQYRTIAEEINAITAVTIDEVNSLITKLKPGDFTQCSMGPK